MSEMAGNALGDFLEQDNDEDENFHGTHVSALQAQLE